MSLRFELHRPETINDHHGTLSALERDISYPLDDDRFVIDHGDDYGAFLASLGDAYWLLVFEDDALLGVIAGALRFVARPDGRTVRSVYVADLKLRREARGGRVARRLLAHGLWLLLTHPDAKGLRFVFGAGMQGDRGDVRTSFRGRHVGRLGSGIARTRLYFCTADQLAALRGEAPTVTSPGVDFSGDPSPLVRRNTGTKDFRLQSTGAPWRLAHLPRGPSRWGDGLGAMLREAAPLVEPGELACFCLDERLIDQQAWLSDQGIEPGASCNIIGLAHPFLGRRPLGDPSWVHLSTAEI